MKGFRVVLNILEIMTTINKMVLESIFGPMEKYIKVIGLMEKSLVMENGLDKIHLIKENGVMDLLKEKVSIYQKMVY